MSNESHPDPAPDGTTEPPRRVLTPQEAAEYVGKAMRERAVLDERRRRGRDCGWL